jgi:menaquinone-dependent protoporphyrinogen IX oxidase
MKKVLILFKSKTGISKQYATWIAEELACDLADLTTFEPSDLNKYELIVYGAGLFAGQINGIGKIKRWIEAQPQKVWVVFATGATPSKESYQELIYKTNFHKGEARPDHFFYLLSGINYEKMGIFNRLLMRLFSRIADKKEGTPHSSDQTSFDLSNRLYLEELLRYVRLKQR